ncbi:MAG: hypothetical protein ACRDD1_20250, partial [Planctomycetia bacterium]
TVAPAAVLVGVRRVDWVRRSGWRRLAGGGVVAGATAVAVLAVYLAVGKPRLSGDAVEWTRRWHQATGVAAEEAWSAAPGYVAGHYGGMATFFLATAWLALAVGGRRRLSRGSALAAVGYFAVVVALVVNATSWKLPGSTLLFPDRAGLFLLPLAVALGAAVVTFWRGAFRRSSWVTVAFVSLLLAMAGFHHYRGYQKISRMQSVTPAEWQALRWAAENLDPKSTLVGAPYRSFGSYLPGVSGIACTGWHLHHAVADEKAAMLAARPVTHVIRFAESNPAAALPGNRLKRLASAASGRVVYQGPDFAVVELHQPTSLQPQLADSR